jgi:anti-anti-sigma regulatory factor
MPAATHKESVRLEIPVPFAGKPRDELRARLRQVLKRDDIHVILDCGASTQLDVRMVSALVQCASECRERGASFEIANIRSEVRSHILACRLQDRVGITA